MSDIDKSPLSEEMKIESPSRRDTLRYIASGITVAGLGTTNVNASAQESPFGGWFTKGAKGGATNNYQGNVVDKRNQQTVTVEVGAQGNGGTFAFAPPALQISPGTKVTFKWVSNTHNIVVESQPDGASWNGHTAIENKGFTYTHTFSTEGIYKYYCRPHLPLGMKGAIVVGSPSGFGTQPPKETVPQTTEGPFYLRVLFMLGILGAMLLPIISEFYQPWKRETPPEKRVEDVEESPVEEPMSTISHDDYDPVGTAALIAIYFLILVGMWLFMYFIEFLGNGPTVIG
ncbi:MAG: halocyanin domain-containing protein [Halobacteriaceae archaeon]